MFELVFLGTSASAPSIQRGLAAQIVLANEYRFLVDCGEGTQRQILKSGIGFRRLNHVLLTHSHLDHILGLAGLVSTLVRWEENLDEINIYGSSFTLERVYDLIFRVALRTTVTPIPIKLIEVQAGDILHEDKHISVQVFPVEHRGPGCFGYIFKQKDHRLFLAEKADALAVPHSKERSLLVNGHSVTLPDGRTIHPDEVLGEVEIGAKLVLTGDVANDDALRPYVRDADCLVTEATYLEEEAAMAAEVGHITAAQGARLALTENVRTLILTHISRRNSEYQTIREAQAIFPNTYVARDFDRFIINRGQGVHKVARDSTIIQTHE
jgi:ribonuclease Z